MKKFERDLIDGIVGEIIISCVLKDNGFEIISFNDDKRFDIKCKKRNKLWKVEVKTDRYERWKGVKTNNLFIETSFKDKPSGIRTTEADILMYYLPDEEEIWIISVRRLWHLMKKNHHLIKYCPNAGDGGNSRGYSMKRSEWRKHFQIKSLPKSEIGNYLFT